MAPQSVHKATNALVEILYIKPDTKELIYINLTRAGHDSQEATVERLIR